jgi:hypothetical protein
VVTRDIPDHGLAYGNPARLQGFVCACGEKLIEESADGETIIGRCPKCYEIIHLTTDVKELA